MSLFSETMTKAVSNYRTLLRRYLPQAERMSKLKELGLRDPLLYSNELALYKTGQRIVDHLLELAHKNDGYYTYSGLATFAKHLKQFLSQYEIVGRAVMHRAQKASKIVLDAIQALMLARTQGFTPELQTQLENYNHDIATIGTTEQHQLHQQTLQNAVQYATPETTESFEELLQHFNGCIQMARNAHRFSHSAMGTVVEKYVEQ